MRKHLIGLTALLLSATVVASPASAARGGFGFHRPFFFHGPGFHDRFAHRPFFFHHRFFHPFFAFGFPFFPPYYAPYYAAYPAYGPGSCQQVLSTVIIYGQPQAAYVTACQQPDGSWRVVP
jgi:hypothetical protein